MRVNPRVFEEKMDMLDDIQIPSCPSPLRPTCEHIMDMVTKPDFSIGSYNTMTELDKRLTVMYWDTYDNLTMPRKYTCADFEEWYIEKATSADLISRARRWLSEHNYLLIKPDVVERAMEAEQKMRQSIKLFH